MGFGRFLRRQRSGGERAEELESYLQIEADESIREGMAPERAWELARKKLGNVTLVREQIYEFDTILLLETCWRNLRLACRSLGKQRAFTAAAVLTLALGIGANTAVFSVADALLLRPLAVPDPKGIVAVDTLASHLSRFGNSSYLDYQDVLRRSGSFESLAVFQSLIVGLNPDPAGPASKVEAADGMLVSGNFFSCFGIVPVAGRAFRPDEDLAPGRSPAAVISYALWQRKFGLSPNVIGRKVGLNGHPFTLVGVASKSFTGPDLFAQPEIYVPLTTVGQLHSRGTHPLTQRSWRGFSVRGRLRRGITLPQVQAELDAIMRDLEREHPETNKDNVMVVRREIDRRFAQHAAVPGLLMALVSLVLLIACANLANLMMANATARLKEISTQLAIGASRGRILAQILTESTLLAALGAACGIALAFACVRGIRGILPVSDTLESPDLRLDNRVLVYTLIVSAVAVLFYGLAPALATIRESWSAVVHNRCALSGGRMVGSCARRLLIAGQVALCTILLIVGALFPQSFRKRRARRSGLRSPESPADDP